MDSFAADTPKESNVREDRDRLARSLIGKRVIGLQYFGRSDYYRLLFEDDTEIAFRFYEGRSSRNALDNSRKQDQS